MTTESCEKIYQINSVAAEKAVKAKTSHNHGQYPWF